MKSYIRKVYGQGQVVIARSDGKSYIEQMNIEDSRQEITFLEAMNIQDGMFLVANGWEKDLDNPSHIHEYDLF